MTQRFASHASAQPLADEHWLTRVRGEYLEMPGLSLTQPQAQRLWGLERDACAALLEALLQSGFLRRTSHGGYVRADIAWRHVASRGAVERGAEVQLLKSPSARSKIIEVKVRGQIVQPATDGAIDLDLAARSPVNVMLTASSDADRAAWARAIHDRSVRRDRPFVAVSGRAFPAMNRSLRAEDVDEWFERSSGGTLFIDQVGELTLSAQTRLLSMLTAQSDHADEGAMSHTGHGVRVIAGSDRSLRTDLAYGAFSNELFYRLNLIHLDQMHEEDPEKMP